MTESAAAEPDECAGTQFEFGHRARNIGKSVNVDEVLVLRDQGEQGMHPVLAKLLKQHGSYCPSDRGR